MATKQNDRKSLGIYLLLAFGLTWLCWIPTLWIADQQGYILPTITNFSQLRNQGFADSRHIVISIIFSLAVYGPLAGSLAAAGIQQGRSGLADLGARMIKWRLPVRWYGAAVGLPLLIAAVPRLIATLTRQVQAEISFPGGTLPILVGLLFWQLLTSGLGEEPGWRGFLLPYLRKRLSPVRAVWVHGFIWAVWHFPITIWDTLTQMAGVPVSSAVITIAVALVGQIFALVGISYLYAWLYQNTGSLLLAMLFHAWSNFLPAVLLLGVSPSLNILMAVIPWVIVFAMEKILGGENFPG